MALKAIALNCTLKPSGGKTSSTDRMIDLIADGLCEHNVKITKTIRIADFNVKPGVTSDEGEGDDWPELRKQILDHDILILGTPVWLGQMSSVAKRVLERMDAFLGETDDQGRMPSFSKVAVLAVVGNEDGAHSICASAFQALNDTGWTIPASAVAYWVGEAMGSTDFVDLEDVPENVSQAAVMAASNAAHLAGLLKQDAYPGSPQ
ncbi:multimeric flavodoxin WrbA [Novosphingobium hassiacum]|uniref:Multimeric flavodoxin WrbA n=1 Tax=Novosphingobium hassiacum TaxID=173676 RepID=A0A7W5ZSQ6_9SPHN|nr:NAD(P)H-dependent oxidoreductase [Novosphingobium hassiacum]MBB3858776.1 multimeric flavodoxin WrbA [Novosphingobium hassiacum]